MRIILGEGRCSQVVTTWEHIKQTVTQRRFASLTHGTMQLMGPSLWTNFATTQSRKHKHTIQVLKSVVLTYLSKVMVQAWM